MRQRTKHFLASDGGKIVLLLVLVLILALGGVQLGQLISASMLRADAISTSSSLVASLDNTVDDLPAIVAGSRPADESSRLLASASQIGDIYRCRIWDPSGNFVFKSERLSSPDPSVTLSDLLGTQKAQAVLSGAEITESHSGIDPQGPGSFAISFIPVRRGGVLVCVFEVYLDQTAPKALYERSLLLTESIVALALLLASGLPAILVYRRMQDHTTLALTR